MKKFVIVIIVLIWNISANCQENKKIGDYFPIIQSKDTILNTEYLLSINSINIDTIVALKYFFNNNIDEMHDIEYGYNSDTHEDFVTPYTKKVYPLFKKTINKTLYLLCYSISYVIYMAIYDYEDDNIESTIIVVDNDPEADAFIWSTIFINKNYIVTLESIDKLYYILSKIDYESRKFIELKRVETIRNQSYDAIMNNSFYELGISEEGELLENTE
jgi:hypothetical protein